jgi:hypothetical protein
MPSAGSRERASALAQPWKWASSLPGHPEQLADHRDRQRVGQVVHDVELAPVSAGVEQPVDQLADAPVHAADPRGRELLHDQQAQLVVLGRVEEDERRVARFAWRGEAPGRHQRARAAGSCARRS